MCRRFALCVKTDESRASNADCFTADEKAAMATAELRAEAKREMGAAKAVAELEDAHDGKVV